MVACEHTAIDGGGAPRRYFGRLDCSTCRIIYNLHLTAEQLEIRDTVRGFVRDEIKPVTLHPRRLEPFEKPLLTDLLAGASQMGLRALALSEAAGGAGADHLTACLVMEELAQGDPDIAVVLAHTSVLAHLMFDEWMTPAQRARCLPAFIDDHAFHLAYAGREAQAGLAPHYHQPVSDEPAPQATAVKSSNGDWLVNGEIPAVANAQIAKLFAVAANTPQGVMTILVSRETAGFNVQAPPTARGVPAIRWGHGAAGKVMLKDCRVPVGDVLSGENQAAARAYAMRVAPLLAAANIGIGQVAFDAAIDYTKLRRQGGKKTIEHQAIGTLLADIAIKLEAARNMAWKAAWVLDHPDAVADRSVSGLPLHHMARSFVGEVIVEVTERAAECFGAMGVMRDMPLQQYVDDALMFKHSVIGANATKLLIAEAVAGYDRAATS
jgi:alkylation response protein AidB-like acyl-CoA dehydrogenase